MEEPGVRDEIRVQGWDQSCVETGKTPGQLLAENVKKCVGIVRKQDPECRQDRALLPGQG